MEHQRIARRSGGIEMFTIHHQTNRISPVKVKTFSELGFTERKHLQEWLAHQADSPTAEAGEPPAQAGQPIDAATRICEFLDAPDLDEVKLNFGNSQRIMLVAANFRKRSHQYCLVAIRSRYQHSML